MDDKDFKGILKKMYEDLYGKSEQIENQEMDEEEIKRRYEMIKKKLAKTEKKRIVSNEIEASELLKMIMQVKWLMKKHHLI